MAPCACRVYEVPMLTTSVRAAAATTFQMSDAGFVMSSPFRAGGIKLLDDPAGRLPQSPSRVKAVRYAGEPAERVSRFGARRAVAESVKTFLQAKYGVLNRVCDGDGDRLGCGRSEAGARFRSEVRWNENERVIRRGHFGFVRHSVFDERRDRHRFWRHTHGNDACRHEDERQHAQNLHDGAAADQTESHDRGPTCAACSHSMPCVHGAARGMWPEIAMASQRVVHAIDIHVMSTSVSYIN